jgi:pSer/pThr/pTyr-binding forkhead associated (FHA) protein
MNPPPAPTEFEPAVRPVPAAELPPGFAPLRLMLQPSGLALELARPSMIFGRHSRCDVRLPLADVSRRHCRFWFQDGAWWVEDLESMNGVFVNDARVARWRLAAGDLVRIGSCAFSARPPADSGEHVLRTIADAIPARKAS